MVGPFAALESFALNAFRLNARASRSEYWWPFLFQFIVFVSALLMDGWTVFVHGIDQITLWSLLSPWLILLTVIPQFTLTVRRLHDTGKSGLFLLIGLVPIVGPLWLYFVLAMPSKPDENRWGNPPGMGWSKASASGAKGQAEGKHNPFASYAYLINGESDPTPETIEKRRAEVQDYYRNRVLGEGA